MTSAGSTANPPGSAYRIAGCRITVDQPLSAFAAFVDEDPSNLDHQPAIPVETWHCATRGLVGDRIRSVECQSRGSTLDVCIEGHGQFAVSTAGQIHYPKHLKPASLTQVLCGPLLPLAMAWKNIFCLHGSALMRSEGLTVLLGMSGAGKSTLATALSQQNFEQWADDTIAADAQEIGQCLGHYPQPKWPKWRGSIQRQSAPLHQLIFLMPGADTACSLSPTPPAQATLALIEHTLTGRLFAPSMLRRQLKFAASLADTVPCWTLNYRQELASLTPMIDAISSLKVPS